MDPGEPPGTSGDPPKPSLARKGEDLGEEACTCAYGNQSNRFNSTKSKETINNLSYLQ